MECIITMRLSTTLVCKEDKIACEVVKNGRFIDLSSIAAFSQLLVCHLTLVPPFGNCFKFN